MDILVATYWCVTVVILVSTCSGCGGNDSGGGYCDFDAGGSACGASKG